MTEEEVEEFIRASFEENFELLRMSSGHSITDFAKTAALTQVLLYWKKLRDVALTVTDTEIKLTLPDCVSPDGRHYAIEGVVDIVRDSDETRMYDIKTHDCEYVKANIAQYEEQLNIYAHIWQELRGQSLDSTAVIATALTDDLRRAYREGDAGKLATAIEQWEPMVNIPLDHHKLDATVRAFGEVIDQIENHEFAPPPVSRLKERASPHKPIPFGVDVCRNCDARFSCKSYRQYAKFGVNKPDAEIKSYFDDYGSDVDRSEWLDGNLPSSIESELNV